MAKAIFSKPFDFTDHTRGISVHVDASDKEVTLTEEIISAAIESGVATRVGDPPKTQFDGSKYTAVDYTGKPKGGKVTAKLSEEGARQSSTDAAPVTTSNPTAKTSSTSTSNSATVSNTASNATTTSKG